MSDHEEEPEVYGNVYEVKEIHLSGTFTNCQININTGAPQDPPDLPPGGGSGGSGGSGGGGGGG